MLHTHPAMGGTTQPESIPDVDRQLESWARTVLPAGSEVSLEAPQVDPKAGLHLYLLEITGSPPPRATRRAPHQLQLRYLVTGTHPLLSDLLFAALEREDFEVDLSPLPAAGWAAFGVPPRPSFVLVAPLTRARPEAIAPRVRHPLEVRATPAAPLQGVVLGPGEVPISGALVEVPGLDLAVRTNHRGEFQLAAVPATQTVALKVRAKGEVRTFTAEPTGEAVTLRFEFAVSS
jgi:hypothetical protein